MIAQDNAVNYRVRRRALPTLIVAGALLNALVAIPAYATDFHVRPTGTPSGDGSDAAPWDLVTALRGPSAVRPGDSIWIHSGTYRGAAPSLFTSTLNGSAASPIIVRAARGERATIDGGIAANGSYTWFWGLEITNSSPTRRVVSDGTNPVARVGGINLYGRGTRAINLVVHDTGHPAIGFWNGVGDGGEVYGCLIWGNGIYDPTFSAPGHRGNGTYAQNNLGDRFIRDNISFRNFTEGLDASSDGVGYVNGFTFEGNMVFDNPRWQLFTQTRMNPMERLRVIDNYTYRRRTDSTRGTAQFGYYDNVDHLDVVVRGNTFVMGNDDDRAFFLKRWRTVNVAGNTFVSQRNLAMWDAAMVGATGTWDRNTYHHLGGGNPFIVGDSVGGTAAATFLDFAGWRASTGFDGASTYTRSAPMGSQIFVRRNTYEPDRAHIAIYNWDLSARVSVDVSGVLAAGQTYELRDAQNYYGAPIVAGTYDGTPIAVPMNLTQVAPLVGDVDHIADTHTAPEFAVFVLLAGGAAVPPSLDAGIPTATDGGAIPLHDSAMHDSAMHDSAMHDSARPPHVDAGMGNTRDAMPDDASRSAGPALTGDCGCRAAQRAPVPNHAAALCMLVGLAILRARRVI